MRPAVDADIPAIEAFLGKHAATTMFLRANLARHGLGNRTHPHGTTYFVEGDGAVTGVFGISNAGFVMGQGRDWPAFARAIAGREMIGLNGAKDQVEAGRVALGLVGEAFVLDRDEPHYRLALRDLDEAKLGPQTLRLPTDADLPWLTAWNAAYTIETLGAFEGAENEAEAMARSRRMIDEGYGRILMDGDTPVAMTAFNAELPEMVQIGGVYTPPELRGRGYARTAVGRHLIKVRDKGVREAILFASGEAACRAYEAIGFQRIGVYTLVILAAAHEVAA
ncbi:MAG: GNAT family N-acetyltransferase [Pseudomonadota bacterium]|nr:GNAT family N-acetyltransferase [Pseudomonadota bacterium]